MTTRFRLGIGCAIACSLVRDSHLAPTPAGILSGERGKGFPRRKVRERILAPASHTPAGRGLGIGCLVACVVVLAGVERAEAAKHLTYEDVLAHLTDLELLPVVQPGVYCKQFSSYDRRSRYDAATDTYEGWQANGDRGQYIRIEPDTKEGVMAEMEGPGCIFRIWSANPQGVIRFYLDGDAKPTYEFDFMKLCTGAVEPFITPLVWKRDPDNRESASNVYLPIPFGKSCKVTSVIVKDDGTHETPTHYYIIDYRMFPKDWTVDSFKLPLTDAQSKAVQTTAATWGGARAEDYKTSSLAIEPGATVTAQKLDGPGVITALRAKLHSEEKWATRKVMIRAYWDGEVEPSIDCPIGDFFGDPLESTYRSYPMEVRENMNSCFFPMPFRRSATISFLNEGHQPVELKLSIGHVEREVPEDWGYFHAKWRTELGSTSFDYPLIEATGTGKLVGIALFPHNHHGGWWGEGDEKVYVDGEKFPSWFGTGSEDYFGDAWGIRHFSNPSHGFPQHREGSGDKELFACYRWHIGDSIPFYASFKMTIENYAGLPGQKPRNDYSSVAYWYQLPGGSDFFKPTRVGERVPREYVAPNSIEVETYADPKQPGAALIDDEGLPQPLSSGQAVKLTGKAGDTFTLQVPAEIEDRHVLHLGTARGVKASVYELLSGAEPVGQHVWLKKGLNPITVRFAGEPV